MTNTEKSLGSILIDVPALRSQLVELMKEGVSDIPLDILLIIIKDKCLVKEK